jgi:hypothetical protein
MVFRCIRRILVHLEIAFPGVSWSKRARDGELIALVQVIDQHGNRYHDYGLIDAARMKSVINVSAPSLIFIERALLGTSYFKIASTAA